MTTAILYDTNDVTDPFNSVLHTVWFEYDVAGRQTAVVQGIDLDQDAMIETTDANLDGVPDRGTELVRTTTTYDQVGQQKTATDALGVVTSFEYDKAGRLTKTTADAAGCSGPANFIVNGCAGEEKRRRKAEKKRRRKGRRKGDITDIHDGVTGR